MVDCVWNVMAHAQKPEFIFRRNGRVHLNRRGPHFSRLLAAEVCAWAVVMLDTPRSEVVWRVLATHSIRQFPLHFLSRASLCAIRFQTHSAWSYRRFSALQSCKLFLPVLELTESPCRFTDVIPTNPQSCVCFKMAIYQAEKLVAEFSPSIQLRRDHWHVIGKHTLPRKKLITLPFCSGHFST
jgi:hypothetical protein